MSKRSAGILPYRKSSRRLEVFLVHPGGPLWARRDRGAWSIPKGEFEDEEPVKAAVREFTEETGFEVTGELIPLEPLRQPGGKIVQAWAMQADLDPAALKSNTFKMEWPPRSGRTREFPEIDRAAWFPIDRARAMILRGQVGFLLQLEEKLGPEESSGV
jgi:predicted NUDIX family NTP pyrophosphohydrolase